MAKGSASAAERMSALIADIEAEAYARGRADARSEVLKALGAAEGSKRPAKARRRAGGRAPRGSVRRLVERVLGEHPGSTAPEIADRAAGDVERSVKLSSIRVELGNGLARQRYVCDNGRWSLPPAGPSGEDAAAAPTEAGGKEDRGRLGLSW